MHVVCYTAVSIDGRIADANGSLQFLDAIAAGPDEDDFSDFLGSVDAIVVGASTLRWFRDRSTR